MCFQRLLLPTMVEHTTPLLQPLREWSVLLVGTVVLEFGLLDLCPRANWIGSTNGFDGFDPLGY
jgi:hypothetical protein